MKILSRKYIDIHYVEAEQDAAEKIGKQLLKRGYELVAKDAGSAEYDFCDQYLGCEKMKIKKL